MIFIQAMIRFLFVCFFCVGASLGYALDNGEEKKLGGGGDPASRAASQASGQAASPAKVAKDAFDYDFNSLQELRANFATFEQLSKEVGAAERELNSLLKNANVEKNSLFRELEIRAQYLMTQDLEKPNDNSRSYIERIERESLKGFDIPDGPLKMRISQELEKAITERYEAQAKGIALRNSEVLNYDFMKGTKRLNKVLVGLEKSASRIPGYKLMSKDILDSLDIARAEVAKAEVKLIAFLRANPDLTALACKVHADKDLAKKLVEMTQSDFEKYVRQMGDAGRFRGVSTRGGALLGLAMFSLFSDVAMAQESANVAKENNTGFLQLTSSCPAPNARRKAFEDDEDSAPAHSGKN
jgi:hypothetical protein